MGGKGGRAEGSTEIYVSATDDWNPGPTMDRRRYGHTATLLDDGRVFLIGGTNFDVLRDGAFARTEILSVGPVVIESERAPNMAELYLP